MPGVFARGIDENAVDFRPTYDGEENEPVVLPGGFPQSAGQWRGGYRGGHGHLHSAAQCGRDLRRGPHLIAIPNATTAELLVHMPGPDFPTGGVLVEDAGDDPGRL